MTASSRPETCYPSDQNLHDRMGSGIVALRVRASPKGNKGHRFYQTPESTRLPPVEAMDRPGYGDAYQQPRYAKSMPGETG